MAAGAKAYDERQCLQSLLSTVRGRVRECRIYLMSDRTGPLRRLGKWASAHNCSAIVASHEEGSGTRDEHGPWAGLGFYQDMFNVVRARSAIVSSESTSSQLVRALMEYDRRAEAALVSDDGPPELQRCVIPLK